MVSLGVSMAFILLSSAFSHSMSEQPRNVSRAHSFRCFPAIFALGDDWADTGNARTLYPTDLQSQEEMFPYGMTFFRNPSHRLSDGRLMVDFFAQAFNLPLLSSYTRGVASELRQGVSFAVAGSTGRLDLRRVPYPLLVQQQWVQKFLTDVLDALASESKQALPDPSYFRSGLYIILAGQNDYRYALRTGVNISEVKFNIVPEVVTNITATIGLLSQTVQARNFLVMSVPPIGCTPEILTLFASPKREEYDENGCLVKYNQISELHNELLSAAIDRARVFLKIQDQGFNITYLDLYHLTSDLLFDPSSAGFGETLLACCGARDQPYNYHERVICGRHAFVDKVNVSANACNSPRRYISWDGIHTTEAFNRYAVDTILHGHYIVPSNAFRCSESPEAASSPPTSRPPPPPPESLTSSPPSSSRPPPPPPESFTPPLTSSPPAGDAGVSPSTAPSPAEGDEPSPAPAPAPGK